MLTTKLRGQSEDARGTDKIPDRSAAAHQARAARARVALQRAEQTGADASATHDRHSAVDGVVVAHGERDADRAEREDHRERNAEVGPVVAEEQKLAHG